VCFLSLDLVGPLISTVVPLIIVGYRMVTLHNMVLSHHIHRSTSSIDSPFPTSSALSCRLECCSLTYRVVEHLAPCLTRCQVGSSRVDYPSGSASYGGMRHKAFTLLGPTSGGACMPWARCHHALSRHSYGREEKLEVPLCLCQRWLGVYLGDTWHPSLTTRQYSSTKPRGWKQHIS
jgi:hypothetical protein